MASQRNVKENENIFAAVQERYTVREVAEQLGIRLHKVGGSLRSDSIFGSGEGHDAFAVYPESNRWYDFMENKSGDVTDLVAYVKFNGDKKAALQELMPEWNSEKIKIQKNQRDEFMKEIERWHADLMNPNKPYAVRAMAYLHSRKITDETIKEQKIGVAPFGATYRLTFPYWDESRKNVLYFTSRSYDWSGKGENPDEQKYMKASLSKYPFLKNSIQGLDTLNRGKEEIVVTEGEFDFQAFRQEGYSVITPNGGDFGKLTPQAIEKIKDFKMVYLAFDNDEAGKEFTYKMARELIKEHVPFMVCEHNIGKDISDYYQVRGNLDELIENARMGTKWCVQECLAPTKPLSQMTIGEQDKVKKKIREFILEISPFTDEIDITDIVLSLSAFFDKTWLNETKRIGKKGMSEMEINEVVKAKYQLMYNEKCGFYEYEDGIWQEKMNDQIGGHIATAYGRSATGSKVDATLRLLKKDETIWSEIPLNSLNMQSCVTFMNGTVHIDEKGNGTLRPFSAKDYTTVKLPYRFDADATCIEWTKFLKEVTNGNKKRQRLLKQFAGYLLLPDCRFQKALLLQGDGSNGKSVFVNVLSKMLGGSQGYVSYVEPSKLVKDFRLMPFKNSWLNVSSDTENDLRCSEGVFKKIVAGENLEDAYKFHSPFSFPTRSKMIMCCNYFPTITDTSDGFMRRFLIVHFPMHYVNADKVVPNTNKRPLDVNLEQKLLKELPGIFNWALEGLQELLAQNGFTETDEQERLINTFIAKNNNLMSFAGDNEETFFEVKGTVKEGKTVKKRQVFRDYRHWTEECLEISASAGRFYAGMIAIFARLGWEFSEKDGFWTFKDIKLAEPEHDNNEGKAAGEKTADLVAEN